MTARPRPYTVASVTSFALGLMFPLTVFVVVMGSHFPTAKESRYDIFGGMGVPLAGCFFAPIIAIAAATGAIAATAVGIARLRNSQTLSYPTIVLTACAPALLITASFLIAPAISRMRRPQSFPNPSPLWSLDFAVVIHIAVAATVAAMLGLVAARRMTATALASSSASAAVGVVLAIFLCGAAGFFALLIGGPALALVCAILGIVVGWVFGSHIGLWLDAQK